MVCGKCHEFLILCHKTSGSLCFLQFGHFFLELLQQFPIQNALADCLMNTAKQLCWIDFRYVGGRVDGLDINTSIRTYEIVDDLTGLRERVNLRLFSDNRLVVRSNSFRALHKPSI